MGEKDRRSEDRPRLPLAFYFASADGHPKKEGRQTRMELAKLL